RRRRVLRGRVRRLGHRHRLLDRRRRHRAHRAPAARRLLPSLLAERRLLMTTPVIPREKLNLAIPVTALLKGPVYRDTDATAWAHLRGLSTRVSDHMATFGLDVVVDEIQGFAYLRSRPEEYLD